MTNTRKEEGKKLAILFHDTYESLAPVYGYETKEDTKNFDPESKNGRLMIAFCNFVLENYISTLISTARKEGYEAAIKNYAQ